MMELLIQYAVPIVTGMMGGGAASSMLKNVAMGMLPKLLSGGLGGLAGGAGLSALLGGGAAAATAGAAAGGVDMGSLLTGAVGGGAGGAILTGIVGKLMGGSN